MYFLFVAFFFSFIMISFLHSAHHLTFYFIVQLRDSITKLIAHHSKAEI